MTDITELAQSLKAAAEKATPGEWRRASTQFNGITATPFMIGRKEVMIAGVSEKRDAEFIAMGNPANILALVEALEKAQAENTAGVAGMAESYETTISMLRSRIAELKSRTVTAAAADVLAERKRQVTTEGWTPEHDDQHVNFEMAIAGGLYAISAVDSHHKLRNSAPSAWPWDRKWWKTDGPRRDLVKAGALILAEIERLDRAAGIKVEAE
ncbi:TPA: ead/Ea22-like family protein [Klebsiella pneumoniae]|nr:ead/Ea22-like family protein [Klebsiella pneumoniae]